MTAPAHWLERQAAHKARVEADRERNRGQFPNVTQIVDQVRKYFPEAKLLHGVEPDGRGVGQRQDEGIPFYKPVSPPSGKSEAAAARPTSRSRREKPPAGEAAVSPTIRDLLK